MEIPGGLLHFKMAMYIFKQHKLNLTKRWSLVKNANIGVFYWPDFAEVTFQNLATALNQYVALPIFRDHWQNFQLVGSVVNQFN